MKVNCKILAMFGRNQTARRLFGVLDNQERGADTTQKKIVSSHITWYHDTLFLLIWENVLILFLMLILPISVWLSVDMVYNDKDLKVSFLANLWLSGLFYLGWNCFHLTATARSNFPNLQVVSVKDCINRLFAFGQKWTGANIILDSC